MHPTVHNAYKTITGASLAVTLLLALAVFLLPLSNAVIITLYIVWLFSFVLALGVTAVIGAIVHKRERERMRNNPFHAVWAKNAWSKAREQHSAE